MEGLGLRKTSNYWKTFMFHMNVVVVVVVGVVPPGQYVLLCINYGKPCQFFSRLYVNMIMTRKMEQVHDTRGSIQRAGRLQTVIPFQ